MIGKHKTTEIIVTMVCLFMLVTPIAQAKQPKDFHWGKIIDAHCDARFILNETNISNSLVITRYFVFGIGRHSISFLIEENIQIEEGKWYNDTWGVGNYLNIFRPIARSHWGRQPTLIDYGYMIQGKIIVTLLVDNIPMDSEYCILPEWLP